MTTNGPTPKLYVILGSHACGTGMLLDGQPVGDGLVDRVLPLPAT
jgi:Ni,Fe-hydrogenase III small subunit